MSSSAHGARLSSNRPKNFVDLARAAIANGAGLEGDDGEKFRLLGYMLSPVFEALEAKDTARVCLAESAAAAALGFLLIGLTQQRVERHLGVMNEVTLSWRKLFMDLASSVGIAESTEEGETNVH